MTEVKLIDFIFFGMIITCLAAGYFIGILSVQMSDSESEGLWTSNACDFKGEWVHVNIDGMSIKRALEVCQHEVGHELFAETCEKNWTKCEDIAND